MERNRKRKNGVTKEYISIQSTVNVTVSSQAEKKVGYIDKFMSKADFTARNGKQVCIKEETHERIMKFVNVVGKGQATVASFIDNIINEHFAIHAAEIKAAFDEGLKAYPVSYTHLDVYKRQVQGFKRELHQLTLPSLVSSTR